MRSVFWRRREPSVEILGVKIVRGMPEADIRAAFPSVYFAEKGPTVDPGLEFCSVGDGVPPGADGEVTFKKNCRVLRASRNWFIPEDSNPYETLLMINEILARLSGENSTCGKIETGPVVGSMRKVVTLSELELAT